MRSVRELFDLHDRVALVTGAAGHIGLACCDALAELGAKIVVADLSADACATRAAHLRDRWKVDATPIAADLGDPDLACRELVDKAVAAHGRLDILVNNAAYTGTSTMPGWATDFDHQTLDAWNAAMTVNLAAPFRLAQCARPYLAASRAGTIVNVSSIYGLVGPQPAMYEGTTMANPTAYGASKGGLIQLSRYLATLLAPSIRVNCLVPGGVARNQPDVFRARYDERTPLGRMASEEDFKGAFAFLASDASAYVTGQTLAVDGGWTTW